MYSQNLKDILGIAIDKGASDIHLTVGIRPAIRVDGELIRLSDFEVNDKKIVRDFTKDLLSEVDFTLYEKHNSVDTSMSFKDTRFRVHIYKQKESDCLALRLIPSEVPRLDEINMPQTIKQFTKVRSGLVLVTGVTGSGKSTTLASLVREINENQSKNIITIEQPIEYIHTHVKSIINQREVGTDVNSFSDSVVDAMRADPDILLVGELRDLDTIKNAITMAETGHLVLGTLHTKSAAETIDRIIDVFPPNQQAQIRVQLANSISGIVSQELLPKVGGGRIPSCEIMVNTTAIKNLIKNGGNLSAIEDDIQQNSAKLGSQTKVQSLAKLLISKQISQEVAEKYVPLSEMNTFKQLLVSMKRQNRNK